MSQNFLLIMGEWGAINAVMVFGRLLSMVMREGETFSFGWDYEMMLQSFVLVIILCGRNPCLLARSDPQSLSLKLFFFCSLQSPVIKIKLGILIMVFSIFSAMHELEALYDPLGHTNWIAYLYCFLLTLLFATTPWTMSKDIVCILRQFGTENWKKANKIHRRILLERIKSDVFVGAVAICGCLAFFVALILWHFELEREQRYISVSTLVFVGLLPFSVYLSGYMIYFSFFCFQSDLRKEL